MFRSARGLTGVLSIASLAALAGCPASYDLPLPAVVEHVRANAKSFTAAADDPLATAEPGKVIDALSGLDGCWAAVLTDAEVDVGIGLFLIYQFDRAAGTYRGWSFAADAQSGELPPLAPVVASEEGTFKIVNESALVLTTTRLFTNVAFDSGEILPELVEVSASVESLPFDRSALLTLSGNKLLFIIDADDPSDVDSETARAVFFSLSCNP